MSTNRPTKIHVLVVALVLGVFLLGFFLKVPENDVELPRCTEWSKADDICSHGG